MGSKIPVCVFNPFPPDSCLQCWLCTAGPDLVHVNLSHVYVDLLELPGLGEGVGGGPRTLLACELCVLFRELPSVPLWLYAQLLHHLLAQNLWLSHSPEQPLAFSLLVWFWLKTSGPLFIYVFQIQVMLSGILKASSQKYSQLFV